MIDEQERIIIKLELRQEATSTDEKTIMQTSSVMTMPTLVSFKLTSNDNLIWWEGAWSCCYHSHRWWSWIMAVLNRYNVLIMGDRLQKFTCTRMCNKEIERQKKKSQQISSQSDQFRHVQRHFNVALPAAAVFFTLLTHIKLANNHNLHIVCIKFNCHVVVFAIYMKYIFCLPLDY